MKKAIKNIFVALAGVAELCIIYFLIGNVIGFVVNIIDSNYKAVTEETHINYSYEHENEDLEPYYFDENGIRYVLESRTSGEYYIDDSYEEEIQTPESTAFTSIGYHSFSKTLWVVFRNTGEGYHYYDVPYEVWCAFKNAESKGSYFQEAIRNNYEYDRD